MKVKIDDFDRKRITRVLDQIDRNIDDMRYMIENDPFNKLGIDQTNQTEIYDVINQICHDQEGRQCGKYPEKLIWDGRCKFKRLVCNISELLDDLYYFDEDIIGRPELRDELNLYALIEQGRIENLTTEFAKIVLGEEWTNRYTLF